MKIIKLDEIVSSRIAAGEVVERPASALRELIDNSIDAGSTKITVNISDGGLKEISITDNGSGIDKDDLPMAFARYATSKIKTIDDIFSLRTLGFRGEALASISACSRTTISSKGYSLTVDNGHPGKIQPSSINSGTMITVENLFEKLPARLEFLKRSTSEFKECKKVLIEKALGFENIEFVLLKDGVLDAALSPKSKKDRVLEVLSYEKNFKSAETLEMSYEEDGVKLYAVCSVPAQYRRDRQGIKTLINERVVDNYALIKVIANAYSVVLPGGAYPYFYLFVEENPELADFNVHPTKRECRLRNQSFLFSMVSKMIREGLKRLSSKASTFNSMESVQETQPDLNTNYSADLNTDFAANFAADFAAPSKLFTYTPPSTPEKTFNSPSDSYKPKEAKFSSNWVEKAKETLKTAERTESIKKTDTLYAPPRYIYIGQAFNTFLIVETDGKILFVDQHAAHERILYNEIIADPASQKLAVPYQFETDSSVDKFLLENSYIYADLGVTLAQAEPRLWEIYTVPAWCKNAESEIAGYISKNTGDLDEARKGLFAVIACHAAIKAGDVLDRLSATELLDKVFKLDELVCPHGRSFVYTLTKEELFKQVGRIV